MEPSTGAEYWRVWLKYLYGDAVLHTFPVEYLEMLSSILLPYNVVPTCFAQTGHDWFARADSR